MSNIMMPKLYGKCVWCGRLVMQPAGNAKGRWFLLSKLDEESASRCQGYQSPDGKHDPGASIVSEDAGVMT